jgi:hypothetical protein
LNQSWLALTYSHGELRARSSVNPPANLRTSAFDRTAMIHIVHITPESLSLALLDHSGLKQTKGSVIGLTRELLDSGVDDPEEVSARATDDPFTFVLDLGKAGTTGDMRTSADMEILEISLYGSLTSFSELKEAAHKIMNSYGVIW